jgi:hypothetical protein
MRGVLTCEYREDDDDGFLSRESMEIFWQLLMDLAEEEEEERKILARLLNSSLI